jgi:hypothetical protein
MWNIAGLVIVGRTDLNSNAVLQLSESALGRRRVLL